MHVYRFSLEKATVLLPESLCCTVRTLALFFTSKLAMLYFKRALLNLTKVAGRPEVVACPPQIVAYRLEMVACRPQNPGSSYCNREQTEHNQGILKGCLYNLPLLIIWTAQKSSNLGSQTINLCNFIAWRLMKPSVQVQWMQQNKTLKTTTLVMKMVQDSLLTTSLNHSW